MSKIDRVWDYIDGLNEDGLIELHNELVDMYGDDSDHIYYMNEFNDEAMEYSPLELLEHLDDFRCNDCFFRRDDFDCFASFNSPYDVIDEYDMAMFIVDNYDDCGISELAEILESDDCDYDESE